MTFHDESSGDFLAVHGSLKRGDIVGEYRK